MDMEEIRYLLGGTIFARAKAYTDRIQDLNCEVAGNGVRHLSADVRGGGRSLYQTQVWLTAIIRRSGCGKTAALSAPAAPAPTTKTARGPAASTSVHC